MSARFGVWAVTPMVAVVVVVGVAMFTLIAHGLAASSTLRAADQALTDSLQSHTHPAVLDGFALITHLADTATLTMLCIAIALLLLGMRQRQLAVVWVAAIAGNAIVNTSLKAVFERARPLRDSLLTQVDGLSFPSGHSSGALVTYCMLAYLARCLLQRQWHLPALLAAVALVISIGSSRVFLQAHFASDVLAGLASGSVWLALCIAGSALLRKPQLDGQHGSLRPEP